MKLHPLETTGRIRDAYIRYLKTLFPIQDPTLAREFEAALLEPDMLVKGPLVEISPAFEREKSIKDLVDEGVLHSGFAELCSADELPYARKLYRHQELAIRKVVAGRNIVVATGTGSGKTEAFLIPLFNYLLQERASGTLAKPGVRALLLYPMNALANDQLKRLRRLLRSFPDITFGRYTGETEQQRNKAEDKFRKNHPHDTPLRNELLSRAEMQARPPHLLLTNYAMLEYLLLRPQDAPFFDGDTAQHWRFIVLDEAHVYDGAQAIEIGMLLRRLKDRVVRSEPGRLSVIATSATLGRGREDFPAVRDFAANLFGERFEWDADDAQRQDIVEAFRVPIDSLGPTWGRGNGPMYAALRALLDNGATPDIDALKTVLSQHGVPGEVIQDAQRHARQNGAASVGRFLYAALLGDESLRMLHRALSERPRLLHEVAEEVFSNDEQAANTVVDLVALAVRARPGADEAPLLPARYHLFARALEGAFVCLDEAAHKPDDAGNTPARLYLNRHERCAHPECRSRVFEVAQCPRCGTAYLIGQERIGRELPPDPEVHVEPDVTYLVHEAPTSQNLSAVQTEYFMLDTEVSDQEDEDELVATETQTDRVDRSRVERYTACVKCGAVAPGEDRHPGCSHSSEPLRRLLRVHAAQGHTLTRCVKCGVQGRGGVLYRFLTGQDAPVSVLATALYQEVPPSKEEHAQTLPGKGRKMLMFADSRQDAAFFAPYLERTYGGILRRRLILKTLAADEDGLSGRLRIRDIVERVLRKAEDFEFFRQEQSYDERKRIVGVWMALELIALDRRISLEGVGLFRIALIKPRGWQPPPPLLQPPWNLDADEAWTLIATLLDSLRRQGVVTLPEGVDPRIPDFAPRNCPYFVRERDADPRQAVFGWAPKRGQNARLNFLVRWLEAHRADLSPEQVGSAALDVLDGLWRYLTTPGMWSDHFPMQHDNVRGVVHQLSHKMWEFQPTLDDPEGWFICDRCGNLSALNAGNICPTYRCQGTLQPLASSATYARENHYRRLYAEMEPIPLSTEEHTAQLASQAAAEIQDRFVRGEVNALSCSTTFELGVDVGDLQTVLLRNVPPTTANYVQRAGRAGRRTDAAAFALTFAQRRSHDLTFYGQPENMVAGKINPPVVSLTNEKIVRRHVHSVAFADFFRDRFRTRGIDYRKVGVFFEPPAEGDVGPDAIRQYLDGRPDSMCDALKRIVPADLLGEMGISDWGWVRLLTNAHRDGVLDKAEFEIRSDLEQIAKMEQEAAAEGRYGEARHFQQVRRNIRSRSLLGELARRNVLPKYGFPVDVVELKTSHLAHIPAATRVELDRDLKVAISEYAPGGQVVAAKMLWESSGIRLLPGRRLDEFNYAVCPRCQRFHFHLGDIGPTCHCGESLTSRGGLHGKFIIPEHGFVAGRNPLQPGEGRPQRSYSSRVFFAEYRQPRDGTETEELHLESDGALSSSALQVYKGHSRYGWLAMVNAGVFGLGFRLCQTCGYAEAIRPRSKAHAHGDPISGRECRGTFATYHLGHRYMTDVVELRFDGLLASSAGERLWRSLLYALLEGASEALGIRRDDIDGTLFQRRWGEPPSLILFDSVPGGAGHVRRIYDNLAATARAAYRRVVECECGPETSCYECLRNYYNQYLHADLQRGIVADFLGAALDAANLSRGA